MSTVPQPQGLIPHRLPPPSLPPTPPNQVHVPQEHQGQRGEGLGLPWDLHDDRRQPWGRRAGWGSWARREGTGTGLGRTLTRDPSRFRTLFSSAML